MANKTMPASPISHIINQYGPKNVLEQFRKQVMAYAQQEYPFQDELIVDSSDGKNVLVWWRNLASHPCAVRFMIL